MQKLLAEANNDVDVKVITRSCLILNSKTTDAFGFFRDLNWRI